MNATSMVLAVAAVATVLLSGCSSMRHASDHMGKWNPNELTPTLSNGVDVIALLSDGQRTTPPPSKKDAPQPSFDSVFQQEIARFRVLPAPEQKLRRNLAVDRLKASSDLLCDDYKSNVLRKQARANFWLGTTSLFLGSAGALVGGVDAARALSGSAAFFTGMRSEYNQDFYLDQTITVIAKSIDKRQQELYLQIAVRRALEVSDYSVMEAIDDMVRYHGTCSLVSALAFTEKAIASYDVLNGIKIAKAAKDEFDKLMPSPMPAPIAVPPIEVP